MRAIRWFPIVALGLWSSAVAAQPECVIEDVDYELAGESRVGDYITRDVTVMLYFTTSPDDRGRDIMGDVTIYYRTHDISGAPVKTIGFASIVARVPEGEAETEHPVSFTTPFPVEDVYDIKFSNLECTLDY